MSVFSCRRRYNSGSSHHGLLAAIRVWARWISFHEMRKLRYAVFLIYKYILAEGFPMCPTVVHLSIFGFQFVRKVN